MAESGGILFSVVRECEHAQAFRRGGGRPNMANCLINLGGNAAGEVVILHVCVECWQQITGLVLAEVVENAVQRTVRKHGLAGLTEGSDGS